MHKPRHIPLRAGVQGLCGCLAICRGKARPGLCAFFLQRMRFGKCDNLLNRRGVRAVFEISHIDVAMHRILFKRFEKGIRRVHLAMIRPDQQPDALRYHVQQHGVLVSGSLHQRHNVALIENPPNQRGINRFGVDNQACRSHLWRNHVRERRAFRYPRRGAQSLRKREVILSFFRAADHDDRLLFYAQKRDCQVHKPDNPLMRCYPVRTKLTVCYSLSIVVPHHFRSFHSDYSLICIRFGLALRQEGFIAIFKNITVLQIF